MNSLDGFINAPLDCAVRLPARRSAVERLALNRLAIKHGHRHRAGAAGAAGRGSRSRRSGLRAFRWRALLRMIAMLPFAFSGARAGFGGVRRADRDAVARGDEDLRAVAQTIGAIDDDAIARRQTLGDRDHAVILGPKLNLAHRHRIVGVDQVDIGPGRAALNGGERRGDDAFQ